jgi:hypothetical protein
MREASRIPGGFFLSKREVSRGSPEPPFFTTEDTESTELGIEIDW